MLSADAFKLVVACHRECGQIRLATSSVKEGLVTADIAFETITSYSTARGILKRHPALCATALVALFRSAPEDQHPALVEAGRGIGLDLQPLLSLRNSRESKSAIRHRAKFIGDHLPRNLFLAWFLSHPCEKVRLLAEMEFGGHRPTIW